MDANPPRSAPNRTKVGTTVPSRFEDIFNHSMDGIIYADLQGGILEVNPAFCAMTGYCADELIGKKGYQDLTPAEFSERDAEVDRQVIASAKPVEFEKVYCRKDGSTFPVLMTVFPVKDGQHQVKAFGALIKDITDRKTYETAMNLKAQELRRSNEELERFAALASHDLREPLITIMQALELIREASGAHLDPTSLELLDHSKQSAEKLAALVSDLLGYARVGSEAVEVERTDCSELVNRVIAHFEQAVREGKAEISCSKLPAVVTSASLLECLFQNLISNSLKYHNGPVANVSISSHPEGEFVQFEVCDNGPGVPAKDREAVFDLFFRVCGTKAPGTGLGLAICRRIVDRLGGRIWIEDNEPQGCRVCFTLPVTQGD